MISNGSPATQKQLQQFDQAKTPSTPEPAPLTAAQQLLAWLAPVAVPVPKRESPLPGQQLQIVKFEKDYGEEYETRTPTTSLERATSISSQVAIPGVYDSNTFTHKPVLDIDFPVRAIESSTPGHFHLYIDKEMSWEDYELLLRTLAAVGIIEPGYLDASLARQHTSVRLPWVRKDAATLANESVETF